MNSLSGRAADHEPGADPEKGYMTVLASLAHIVACGAGAAIAFTAVQTAISQQELVVLLIEMILRVENSIANGAHWFFLALAGLTGALLVGLALKSLLSLLGLEEDVGVRVRLRVFFYLAVGCTVLNVFLFSSPVAINGPFRVQYPVLVQLLATFVIGVYGLWSIRVIRGRSREPSRYRRAIGLVCLNVAMALIAAELLLRVVTSFVPIPLLVTDQSSAKIRRNAERLLPGELHHGFPVNRGGHYDTEFLPPAERTRVTVASIGDSFSYGTVPHPYHYSTVMENKNPDLEVYNLGFPGIGPSDYLHLLEGTALPLEPDLVLIQIFASNDFVAGAPMIDPPRWYDADYYLLGILWYRWQILQQAERSALHTAADASSLQDEGSVEERFPFVTDPMLESPPMGEELYYAIELDRAQQIGIPNPAIQQLFYQSLENLVAAAAERDVPLAFVLIPDEFQVEDTLWERIEEISDVELDRNLVLRETIVWLESRDIPYLDLLPILRAVEPMEDGQRHLYHLRDTHFNARGNRVAGLAMTNLVERVLFGKAEEVARDQVQQIHQSQQFEQSQQLQAQSSNEAQPDSALPHNADMSTAVANDILRQFGANVKEHGVKGDKVFDESLLSEPRDRIKSAIVAMMNGNSPAEEQAFLGEAARVLAFFQPDVGPTAINMDAERSDGQTWLEFVKEDMRAIGREIASRTRTQ